METPVAWSAADVVEAGLVFLEEGVDVEFGLDELLASEAETLGKGTFGASYKAILEGRKRIPVAVKRLRSGGLAGKEFKEKVDQLGKLVHENLLPIKAYCCHKNERLLIYEYMSKGSLDFLLHGNRGAYENPLTWKVRSSILHGVARGITYLHSQGSDIFHGNIKSSNVLLHNTYDGARLSDFGLLQLLKQESRRIPGPGYRAPEVKSPGDISQASDVYSFGVLLLEVLTGKPPAGGVTGADGADLPSWVRSVIQEKPAVDAFDAVIAARRDQNMEEMVGFFQLGICCTFRNPTKRPSMAAVTKQIEVTCKFTQCKGF